MIFKFRTRKLNWRFIEASDVEIFDVAVHPAPDERLDLSEGAPAEQWQLQEVSRSVDGPTRETIEKLQPGVLVPDIDEACYPDTVDTFRSDAYAGPRGARLARREGDPVAVVFSGPCYLLNDSGKTIEAFVK